jgi:hypothetical protein
MTFVVTIYTNVWGDRPVPDHYLGDRRFIEAPGTFDAARIARERFPQAKRLRLTPIPDRS